MAELNDRQALFVEEYFIKGCNATAAYKAVYQCQTYNAHAQAGVLMKNPKVRAAISERFELLLGDKEIIANQLIMELKDVAFCTKDDEDYLPLKMKAIDLLQKQLSLQTQNLNATVEQVIFLGEDTLED